jgi:hypothetical protein
MSGTPPGQKIAHKTNGAKNRPHDKPKNHPQDGFKNRPDIINPVLLCWVLGEAELKALLRVKKQTVWCTRVRLLGLLLVIDYICRNFKNGMISMSADLAHQFVSKLRKKDCATTITEPLLLLWKIGVLERLRPAVHAHVKASAVYCFADPYCKKRLQLAVALPPKLAQKRAFAFVRCEARLNRKFPWREKLLADLGTVRFSDSARRIIAKGLSGKGSENLTRLISAVDTQAHSVTVSVRGQITTSIGSCPRDLQPHLLLDGEPTVSCDIANAHWNFLPKLLKDRLAYVSRDPTRERYVADGTRELHPLVAFLSDGDFYQKWYSDSYDLKKREDKKTVLNILLNKPNQQCMTNALYRTVRRTFPITFGIIEDLKSKDNRNLSKQLHRFTADAIAAALLEVQQKGIAAIPHVDALICREKHHATVCKAIGRQIFGATGVCCTVGGIRYSPLTEDEKQALAFDEIAPSDDGMSYDEWEAVRAVRTAAMLKLTRFIRQVVGVTAFDPAG